MTGWKKSTHVVASPLLENIIHLTSNCCSPFAVVLTTCSVMNSIVDGRANATKGRADDVSTVGVDLQRKQIKGTRVEFYDCAGQLDYAGMQQVFLGGRALYLLVWDVTRCHDHSGGELDEVSRQASTFGIACYVFCRARSLTQCIRPRARGCVGTRSPSPFLFYLSACSKHFHFVFVFCA